MHTEITPGFIVIEGPDYSGKTTIAEILQTKLNSYLYSINVSLPVIGAYDPGCTEMAEKLRKIVKDPEVNISSMVHFLLFQAARIDLQDKVVLPNAKAGGITIMQRWTDSTRVYQGMLQGISKEILDAVFRASECVVPQLIIVLKVSDEEAERRYDNSVRTEQDYFEKKEFRQVVRDGYANIPLPDRPHTKQYRSWELDTMYCNGTVRSSVDADKPLDELVEDCWKVVLRSLKTTVLRDV